MVRSLKSHSRCRSRRNRRRFLVRRVAHALVDGAGGDFLREWFALVLCQRAVFDVLILTLSLRTPIGRWHDDLGALELVFSHLRIPAVQHEEVTRQPCVAFVACPRHARRMRVGSILPRLSAFIHDAYVAGRGRLQASALGLFNMADMTDSPDLKRESRSVDLHHSARPELRYSGMTVLWPAAGQP